MDSNQAASDREVRIEDNVSILCEDGFQIVGTLFRSSQCKSAVMLAPATGIKRQFYWAFAQFLAESGFAVLIFDNRGIGQSIQESTSASTFSLTHWGRLDMTAALEYLKEMFPDSPYHLVGHSAGGQLVGLMKNALDLKSIFNFGSSSGSLKYSKYPFKLKSFFWLNIYIPVSNFLFGHTKSQWVGMGEPLPKGVATEWARWCNGTGYVKVDLDSKLREHLYDDLACRSLWVHAQDDDIANPDSVRDMIRVYSKIDAKVLTLVPEDYGFRDIGHMKFFSKRRRELWPLAVDWLNEN